MIPVRLPRASKAYFLFVLAALIYLYPFLRLAPGANDEGEFLYDAVRVVQGQVPVRDFFEAMAPGTFYWLALFYKLFGVTWAASRIALLVTSLSTAILLYYLARRLKLAFPAAPVILMAAASFGLLWPAISHHGDSTVWGLAAFAVFLRALDRPGPRPLLLAGLLAGVTTCFIQQKGLLLFLSFALVFWLLCRRLPGFRALLAWLFAGYAAVGVCVAALFWSAGALGSLVYADLIFPLTRYESANSVPYALGLLAFYWRHWSGALVQSLPAPAGYSLAALLMVPFLFIALLPILLAALLFAQKRRALNPLTLPYLICGGALWLSELQRKDIWHLVYGSPVWIVLACCLLAHSASRWNLRILRFATACACLLAACNFVTAAMARVPIQTRRGVAYSYRPDPLLEYLNAHIQPGEEIFAYPFRPMYYFLLQANNPTRFTFFSPGMHTDEMFRSTLDVLESHKVKHVIWDNSFEDPGQAWAWPHGAKTSIIEPYLVQHYNTVYTGNSVRVLERKN